MANVITLFIILSLAFSTSYLNLALAQAAPQTPPVPPDAPINNIVPPIAPTPPEAPNPPSAPDNGGDANSDGQNDASNAADQNYDENYSGIVAENSGNGANSQNSSNATSNTETTVEANNQAEINNDIKLEAVTGDNKSSGNTGGISVIDTGDAVISSVVATDVNETKISGSGCNSCGKGVVSVNKDNGSGSTNNANSESTTDTNIDIDNDAEIATEIVALSLTGQNEASRNVGDSVVMTGDANLSSTVITDANSAAFGVYNFDVNGDQSGDIVLGENADNCINCNDAGGVEAVNSGNGTDSENASTSSASSTLTETITNDGDVVNDINLNASSGGNTASYNTGGDNTIVTGDANIVSNVINTLNTSIIGGTIYSVNVFGNLVGDILLPENKADTSCNNCCNTDVIAANSGNGTDSYNLAEANSANSETVNQTNMASIENNLNLSGNTGDNQAKYNTGGDSIIDTGEVDISAETANLANLNVSQSSCGEPLYIMMVNQIGEWVGQIIGAPEGSYIYGSDGALYLVDSGGKLVAVNSGNGVGSVNTASVNSENTTEINQTNNGTIANNINIEANTGNNSTSKNTGGNNTIKTGDANIMVNVVNFINSNFSGRKVILTLVNVFGSFIGNILGPGQQPDTVAAEDSDQNQASDSDTATSTSSNSQPASSSSSNNNNASSSNNQENSSGQIIATTTQTSSGGFGGILLASQNYNKKVESLPLAAASDDTIQTAGFNWQWFLIIIPLVILLYLLRKKFAVIKIKK